ncbi:anthranilate synthase component I family protein [Halalkalibacter nanhaiisediminis]|uniref:Aminodeoxychorismate synthase, subunit I n=1 Tax=Halalkalibacter nanhaiisediminis TaxID=688079 RepID=A0A562Q8W9_9BACI|nr:anthranilate synthase component I family protein [Halalkalibacter nanhaiisediminis]TWI53205.1 aminodeoxychorismate synthase, subunit I [Halalkalibacter nanhaiisediminis]
MGVTPLKQDKSDNQPNRLKRVRSFSLAEGKWFVRYKQLAADEPQHVLLESGRGGRYSIIGLKPFAIISGKNDTLTIEKHGVTESKKGLLLEALKEVLKPYYQDSLPELPPFQGGAIGYLSYDIVREIECLEEQAADDLGLPDLYFMVFDDVFIYDHQKSEMWVIVHGDAGVERELDKRLEEYVMKWTQDEQSRPWAKEGWHSSEETSVQASFSEGAFCEAVEKIKEYIAAGDVFQVNLSVRQTKELTTEPMHVYETLRTLNPSPYMSYVHTPDFQLVSASPELLVKKNGQELSTRPIAGTRSRGKDDEEDALLAATLIDNEKERAEHVMLVDLERNDLGRVSAYGTVEVDELMVIEKYSHVMHIVSNVKGTLDSQYNLYDVIRATFPGGTITGAPKVRTMEIIEELEPVRRSVYTGSIGWIGFDENMELNITIRTMLCKDGKAHVQAGAGIVIDSEPKNEYKESLKKARALWRALELSEEEMRKQVQMS